MAICNLFKKLEKNTGEFLMFSQYTEDLTKSSTSPGFYRVTPSKFMALDINYSNFDAGITPPEGVPAKDLNFHFPKYLQNYFENGCAIMRESLNNGSKQWKDNINHWSTNMFWKALNNKLDLAAALKYIGDINIQSYDEYDGMGYSEIYCYIPNTAKPELYDCKVTSSTEQNNYVTKGAEAYVQGYTDKDIEAMCSTETIQYDYGNAYQFIKKEKTPAQDKFLFNTIIVLYDVKIKDASGEIITVKKDVPMGIYLTGLINIDDGTVGNAFTKFYSNQDIYNEGTSYGLRICSRFTATPGADAIKTAEVTVDNDYYAAFCRVMGSFADSQNKMNEILAHLTNDDQKYNELYAIFKGGRTNVPYIKNVGGIDYWFVNGRNTGSPTQVNAKDFVYHEPYTYEEVSNILSGVEDIFLDCLETFFVENNEGEFQDKKTNLIFYGDISNSPKSPIHKTIYLETYKNKQYIDANSIPRIKPDIFYINDKISTDVAAIGTYIYDEITNRGIFEFTADQDATYTFQSFSQDNQVNSPIISVTAKYIKPIYYGVLPALEATTRNESEMPDDKYVHGAQGYKTILKINQNYLNNLKLSFDGLETLLSEQYKQIINYKPLQPGVVDDSKTNPELQGIIQYMYPGRREDLLKGIYGLTAGTEYSYKIIENITDNISHYGEVAHKFIPDESVTTTSPNDLGYHVYIFIEPCYINNDIKIKFE